MPLPPLRQAGNTFNRAPPIKCAPVIRSSFARRRSRPSIMKFTISCRRTAANASLTTRTTTTKCFCSPYCRSFDKCRKRRSSTSGYRCNKSWPWRFVLRITSNDNFHASTSIIYESKRDKPGHVSNASPREIIFFMFCLFLFLSSFSQRT